MLATADQSFTGSGNCIFTKAVATFIYAAVKYSTASGRFDVMEGGHYEISFSSNLLLEPAAANVSTNCTITLSIAPPGTYKPPIICSLCNLTISAPVRLPVCSVGVRVLSPGDTLTLKLDGANFKQATFSDTSVILRKLSD
jgi:hypothetical protein